MQSAVDNRAPIVSKMLRVGAAASATGIANTGDSFSISYHGYAHTHMDTFCHLLYDGKIFNGYSKDLVTENGASKNSIINFKNGIITRCVLMDMARHKSVDYLEPSTPIYAEVRVAWEKKARVKVVPVLVRTGRWALHVSCANWLHARDAAILGGDGAQDVLPSGVEGISQPIHTLVLSRWGRRSSTIAIWS